MTKGRQPLTIAGGGFYFASKRGGEKGYNVKQIGIKQKTAGYG